MADEQNTNKNEGSGLNRRNFLKSAGAVVAGGTLGAGLTLSSEEAVAAAVEADDDAVAAIAFHIVRYDREVGGDAFPNPRRLGMRAQPGKIETLGFKQAGAVHDVATSEHVSTLIHLTLDILSRRKTNAKNAVNTGMASIMIAALLAVDIRVPQVTSTCPGKTPSTASSRKISASLRSLSLPAPPAFFSPRTSGYSMRVARVMGPHTVNIGPTWSCTSLTQVNCSDHIRLQSNR